MPLRVIKRPLVNLIIGVKCFYKRVSRKRSRYSHIADIDEGFTVVNNGLDRQRTGGPVP